MKSTQKWSKASDRKTMLLAGMAAMVLTLGLVMVGCASSGGTQNNSPVTSQITSERRFNGTWQTADSSVTCVFYCDTYQLIRNGEIVFRGVFIATENQLDCQLSPGMHFLMNYTLSGGELKIVSVQGIPKTVIGQWSKMAISEQASSNPLVGTWKGKTKSGFVILQFYADGTGVDYDCNETLTNMDYVGDVEYNLEDSTFAEVLNGMEGDPQISANGHFKVNGDELTFGQLTLSRQ